MSLMQQIELWEEEREIQEEFNIYPVLWNTQKGYRDGLHASSILESEKEFCHREHVLGKFFKRDLRPTFTKQCMHFTFGWALHELKQDQISADYSREVRQAVYQKVVEEMREMYGNDPNIDELIQRQWVRIIVSSNKAVEVETTHWIEKYGLGFTPDGIWRRETVDSQYPNQALVQDYVLEIKGYKDSVYKDILSKGNPEMNEEFAKARRQANFYMHFLGLKKSIILIENKATQDFITRVKYYDFGMVKPYLDRLDTHLEYVERFKASGKAPERMCGSAEEARAKKCPLKTACFGDGPTRMKIFKEEAKEELLFLRKGR